MKNYGHESPRAWVNNLKDTRFILLPSEKIRISIISQVLVGSACNGDYIEDKDPVVPSKFRSLAAQCCGVLASDCLKFTTCTFTGFHIILIAELHKETSEIQVTLDQLTWIASLNCLVPIGSITNGFIAQRMGSRIVMLLSSFLFIVTWLIYYNATSVTTVVIARVFYALTNGALKTSTGTYVTEVSQPHLRGSFLATYHLAATFGSFFSLLLGSLVHWRTIILINMIFPMISAVIVFIIPDSPIWLASKGRFSEAERALCWLRGWVKPSSVRPEYLSLMENFENSSLLLKDYSVEETAEGRKSVKESVREAFRPYFHRSFYLPFATVSTVYFMYFFSGSSAIQMYSMVIFKKMNSPIDENIATAIMGAMRVAGAFVVFFSIQRAGKRKLLFTSVSIAGVCCLVIGVFGYLTQSLGPSPYLWILPLAMIVAVFGNACGIDSAVHMLNTEIFPDSMRYIGSSFGSSVASLLQSVVLKAFLYLVDAITLPGVFVYFAIMNALAFATYYRVVPETEGRSLREIEDHFGGVKSLGDNQRKNGYYKL